LRIPNVFTAVADIAIGGIFAWKSDPEGFGWFAYLLICLSSACLYASGMAWNDFFDVEQDRRERPFRPIPSGRIARRTAAAVAGFLQVVGLLFAVSACVLHGVPNWTPAAIAMILVGTILMYDGWLKGTAVGPLAMGACRFLNVLFGLSLVSNEAFGWNGRLYLAGVVGIYITGVTWFARTEAATSSTRALTAASGVMLAALCMVLALPTIATQSAPSIVFPYLLVALGFWIGIPIEKAIRKPAPSAVQKAVKRCLIGLVILDAVLATAVAGIEGLLILVLLLPVLYLGRWIYST
jgi:4-hydroxybenzoate polyprenyltransferase